MRCAVRKWLGVAVPTVLALTGAVTSAESEPPSSASSMPGPPAVASAASAVPANAIVEQPRSFGYVIGDVVTQRVLLRLGGKEFVPAELPTTGRAGVWFERRIVRIETDAQGRRWLAIDYQLMNSPQALAVATLPAWKLASKDAQSELRAAAWPMTVGPLTPERPFVRAGLGNLRPDRSAALIALAPMQRTFVVSIALLIATVGAWLAWWAWRNWRASSAQPFAAALREMRHVDDTAAAAWHALHRAFDATAGRAVRAETLPALFDRAPQLQPMRTAIEQFFSQSAARFFAGQAPSSPVSVHALCRDLRRIEKRHES